MRVYNAADIRFKPKLSVGDKASVLLRLHSGIRKRTGASPRRKTAMEPKTRRVPTSRNCEISKPRSFQPKVSKTAGDREKKGYQTAQNEKQSTATLKSTQKGQAAIHLRGAG